MAEMHDPHVCVQDFISFSSLWGHEGNYKVDFKFMKLQTIIFKHNFLEALFFQRVLFIIIKPH